MSLFNIPFFKSEKQPSEDILQIKSPADGVCIPLAGVEDEVFSKQILGDGCAVVPETGELFSPAVGVIDSVFDTGHAISMTADCGAQLLIHCGIDTVKMKGEGFLPLVKEGDRVKAGEPILRFDIELIRKRGFAPTTPVVVLNSDEFRIRRTECGQIKHTETLMTVSRKAAASETKESI